MTVLLAIEIMVAGANEILLDQGKEVLVERDVPMVARDGAVLRADVFRPNQAGKFPVILERNPYDKRNENFGPRAAANGYVFVVQDVRGRFASDGEWYPLRYERDDGYDAVEWAAALPYSNGKVGMFGWSYSAATQLAAAGANPPHLACILPGFIASDCHAQWVYCGGAFSQALNQGWSSSLAVNTLQRRAAKTAQPSNWDMKQPLEDYPMLEVGTGPSLADYYYDWLKHPAYDSYWKELSVEEYFGQITVPALHFGAWYDYFVEGTIRNYLGLKARGGSEAARRGQRLVMAVGGHAGAGPKVGEVDFGVDSVVDYWRLALRWYDYILKGISNGMETEKPVRIFVMGTNEWRDLENWPAPGAVVQPFYLHSGGQANTAAGAGRLSQEAPEGAEPPDHYVYDPANPVPTVGGPAFGDVHLKPGPYDQREVERRSDVLVYSTEPLAQPCQAIGAVTVELFVSSSVEDTDFTGKLVDVGPGGRAINIAEGILRARYRRSREQADLLKPGEITPLTVSLGSTAHVFLPGHRVRLEIASSNFPRFDRNLNRGDDLVGPTGQVRKATNQVHHDRVAASRLVLTVVP